MNISKENLAELTADEASELIAPYAVAIIFGVAWLVLSAILYLILGNIMHSLSLVGCLVILSFSFGLHYPLYGFIGRHSRVMQRRFLSTKILSLQGYYDINSSKTEVDFRREISARYNIDHHFSLVVNDLAKQGKNLVDLAELRDQTQEILEKKINAEVDGALKRHTKICEKQREELTRLRELLASI